MLNPTVAGITVRATLGRRRALLFEPIIDEAKIAR